MGSRAHAGDAGRIVLFLGLGLAGWGGAGLLSAAEPDWQLVWWDEFEVDGAPDPTRWEYERGYIRNNEAQFYTFDRRENARVENGHLVIEARRDFWKGHEYTSASLITRYTASWTYGRIEVRAKIPTGRGMWPAIWTLGTNIGEVGWPDCGEIDIMENVGYDPHIIHGNIHTDAYNHAEGTGKGASYTADQPWEHFHVYAVEWSPERIDIFFNETKYFTFENEGTGVSTWPFFRPQYLILNAAIGGAWGGLQGIDDSIFPQQFLIDYVRVYQLREPGPYTLEVAASGDGRVHLDPDLPSYPEGTTVELLADPDVGRRFAGWAGAIIDPNYRSVITLDRDTTLTARFATPGEKLRNGDFSGGREHWLGPWPSGGAEVAVDAAADELRVEMITPGSELWNVQILQHQVAMEQGKTYVLQFDAWSTEPNVVPAGVNMDRSPWTQYGGVNANLTTEPTTFTAEFTMEAATDYSSRVEFNLGTATGTVHIDNVSLVCLEDRQLTGYEAWQIDHAIRPIHHDEDSDGDGVPAILEYAFGRSVDAAEGELVTLDANGGAISVDLPPREAGTEDVSTVLQRSTDLQTWTPLDGDPTVAGDAPASFLRVVADPETP